MLALFAVLLLWATFGRLDIVAVAQGKLVPETFLKVVQPSDSGVSKRSSSRRGMTVKAGQVLYADGYEPVHIRPQGLDTDFQLRGLQLRRIDAELKGLPLVKKPGEGSALFAQVEAPISLASPCLSGCHRDGARRLSQGHSMI
jgi:HlyD family secretion protein